MLDWYMRLTIVNTEGGQTAMAMYPASLYSILETMDECQIPYGSGQYRHLAVSTNGVPADNLQAALAPVIENEENPPSIRELNGLGKLIQQMTDQEREQLTEALLASPKTSVSDTFDVIQRICPETEIQHSEEYFSDRSVQLSEHDPYIRIQFIHEGDDSGDEKAGIWVDCPASEEQISKIAQAAGVESLEELEVNMLDGVLAFSDLPLLESDDPFQSTQTFCSLNQLAAAMKEHDVLSNIGKFKAILYYEDCMDLDAATELTGKLDEYEFFRRHELEHRFQETGHSAIDDDILDELQIEETPYGFIRKADGLEMDEMLLSL